MLQLCRPEQSRGQATLPSEHAWVWGPLLARTLNPYGTRPGTRPGRPIVSEIRFSDCRDPMGLSVTSLVQISPWLWRQVDRGLCPP